MIMNITNINKSKFINYQTDILGGDQIIDYYCETKERFDEMYDRFRPVITGLIVNDDDIGMYVNEKAFCKVLMLVPSTQPIYELMDFKDIPF